MHPRTINRIFFTLFGVALAAVAINHAMNGSLAGAVFPGLAAAWILTMGLVARGGRGHWHGSCAGRSSETPAA